MLGEREQSRIKMDSAKNQLDTVEQQQKMMEVRAPLDGMVTTWEVKKNLLNKPVDVGTELLSIAGLDKDWVLEVEVPDDDMAPIHMAKDRLDREKAKGEADANAKLEAYFVTMTDPEHRYKGYVDRIAGKADTIEGKHVVKVTVGFKDEIKQDFLRRNHVKNLRSGSEVRARIQCGEAKLAYVLLRDVIQFWHETIMFRWPFMK